MYILLDGRQKGEQNKHIIHNIILPTYLMAVCNM